MALAAVLLCGLAPAVMAAGDGDAINYGLISRLDTLDPVLTREPHQGIVLNHVCGKLFEVSSTLELAPDLVRSFSLDASRTRYTLVLDTARTFQDGTRVTPEDVVFTLFRAYHSSNALARDLLSHVQGIGNCSATKDCMPEGISIHGEELTLRIEKPDPEFIARFTHQNFCILSKRKPFLEIGEIPIPNSPGRYRVLDSTTESLTIQHRSDARRPLLRFKYVPPDRAVDAFNQGIVDDLTFYILTPEEIRRITRPYPVQ
ncbi:MAG: hypothetical protein A2V88_05920 [Elusimicrobia bacterium RBG_16_66_12]|nr:MAG: hypothetical protein A2V88_05920 [Elusimicrobia bacterium RBG_16_66_12]